MSQISNTNHPLIEPQSDFRLRRHYFVGFFRRRRVRIEAEDRELRAMLTLTTQLSSPETIVA